ncbi:MAG: GNAT family N-acetyltransferase [bacterium]
MIEIKRASVKLKKDIKNLYQKVYGSYYSLPEIQDDDLMEEILNDEDNVWVVAQEDGNIVGSLIFRVNKEISVCKAMGAVVNPSHRGRGLFSQMFEFGLQLIDTEIIYALTRTISPEPQKLLLKHNFVSLGIFPNVRRVYAYENHGLYAYIKPSAFQKRKKINELTYEVAALQEILKQIIINQDFRNGALEHWKEFVYEKIKIIPRQKFNIEPKEAKKIETKIINVEKDYINEYDSLRFKFFPFHKPNFKIITEYGSFYLHLNMIDKHCAIMGIDVPLDDIERLYNLFFNIPYIVDKLDARYLEIVSMASKHVNHSIILDNGFIPAAYFPCLIPLKENKNKFRVDAVIFFYPYNLPHFKKLFIPDDFKEYVRYVYSMIVEKINREIQSSLQ